MRRETCNYCGCGFRFVSCFTYTRMLLICYCYKTIIAITVHAFVTDIHTYWRLELEQSTSKIKKKELDPRYSRVIFGSRYLIESWHQSHRPLESLCMRHMHLCAVSHPHTWNKKSHTTLSGSFAAQCPSLVRKPTKKHKPFIESITLFSVFLWTRLRWALLSHCKCQSVF